VASGSAGSTAAAARSSTGSPRSRARSHDLYAALRLGAAGYLLKDMPPGELVQAVLEAGRGEPRIAPRLARRMLASLATRALRPSIRWPR
jgi:DNA-binding NarL/FixJ family response regulator